MECSDGRRLGNIMFNYAALIGLSSRYNATPVMLPDFELFGIFKLSAAKSKNMENTLGMYQNYEEYGRRACAYDVRTEHLKPVNTRFYGYFQSFKYFDNYQENVRREFQFRDEISQEAEALHKHARTLEQVSSSHKKTVIGIHARRGDTLDPYFSSYGYSTPEEDYYQSAMEYFKSKYHNIVFIVCSDDKNWAKRYIKGDQVVYSEHSSSAIDLAILSLCDHVIVSVGSFGWWGAWLANGTTVYYSKWPRPVSKLEYMVTKGDYFYKHWIPLP